MIKSRITDIEDCKIIKLNTIHSERKGSITPVYNKKHIPFDINRIYFLYDVPTFSSRGGHAHKELEQLIVAASGSFEVLLNDGKKEKRFLLNRPSFGLYIPPMMWRELKKFSGGSVCLVLASLKYDENDYFRDYSSFIRAKNSR
tara:strand:- start:2144 stop:2575 length:432 start_codon:yes stop_codon:yes gene_type:complete